MTGKPKFDLCYDEVLFYMWDVTTGQAVNWRECYRGAKHFGRFILSELDRKAELVENGETATVRRGLACADSLIKTWTFNVIDDCSKLRAPLPPELLEVVYLLMGCTHLTRNSDEKKLWELRERFDLRRKQKRDTPTRATARELGVDPATIVRWKQKPIPGHPGDTDPVKYAKILKLTKVSDFAKRAGLALRR